MPPAGEVLRKPAREDGKRDAHGDELQRHEEQHRHEDKLRRDRECEPDLEQDTGCSGIRQHKRSRDSEVDLLRALLRDERRRGVVAAEGPGCLRRRSQRSAGGVGRTLGISDVGYITGDDSWRPSNTFLMLGGTLPLFTQYVQFRFVAVDSSGQFRIDDVYLDPLIHV
jgi:hypothetical protein